jgi:hypothetical protein
MIMSKMNTSDGILPIEYSEADHIIDINNPNEVVGFSDYVFVAQIDGEIGTIYKGISTTSSGREVGRPHTQYKITVIDNLKGNLKKNESIILEQSGGVAMNGKYIELMEGDKLLEEGGYYIILAAGGDDGRLQMTGPTSSIKLDYTMKNELKSSKEYKNYKKFVKNEIKFERDRSKSKYEE